MSYTPFYPESYVTYGPGTKSITVPREDRPTLDQAVLEQLSFSLIRVTAITDYRSGISDIYSLAVFYYTGPIPTNPFDPSAPIILIFTPLAIEDDRTFSDICVLVHGLAPLDIIENLPLFTDNVQIPSLFHSLFASETRFISDSAVREKLVLAADIRFTPDDSLIAVTAAYTEPSVIIPSGK